MSLTRVAMLIVFAVCGLYALADLVLVTSQWAFNDIYAYLGAADRLTAGAPLYVDGASDPSVLYRYAPWFAYLWIPFTRLPTLGVEVGWALILLAATILVVLPYRRSWAGICLALLMGALLYRTAGWGNIQPLVVLALMYTASTRASPWVVGITASLKPTTLLLACVYAWRRQWMALGIAVGVAALLWIPILLFDLTGYPAASRPPNLYDSTIVLAFPAFLDLIRRNPRVKAAPHETTQAATT